jgi:hypothetical protein
MQSDVEWAVFPPLAYRAKDRALFRLGRAGIFVPTNADDSTTYSAGEFEGVNWYLTRDWAIDATQLPVNEEP